MMKFMLPQQFSIVYTKFQIKLTQFFDSPVTGFSPIGSATKLRCFCDVLDIFGDVQDSLINTKQENCGYFTSKCLRI